MIIPCVSHVSVFLSFCMYKIDTLKVTGKEVYTNQILFVLESFSQIFYYLLSSIYCLNEYYRLKYLKAQSVRISSI